MDDRRDVANDVDIDDLVNEQRTGRVIDATIAALLRRREYTAEELFCVEAARPLDRAGRDLAVAKVRAALSDAMEFPTPANFEAAGKACAWLCHMAMAGAAHDYLEIYGVDS